MTKISKKNRLNSGRKFSSKLPLTSRNSFHQASLIRERELTEHTSSFALIRSISYSCRIANRKSKPLPVLEAVRFPSLPVSSSLTEDHKRMIRCVRKIQLIVARNRFQVRERDRCEKTRHSLLLRLLLASKKALRCAGRPRTVLSRTHQHDDENQRITTKVNEREERKAWTEQFSHLELNIPLGNTFLVRAKTERSRRS